MHRGWERALMAAALLACVAVVLSLGANLLWLLVAVAAVAVWWHARRRALGEESLPPHRAMPQPVAPPDEEALVELAVIAKTSGPVTACPECGYLGVRAAGIRDGVWPGGGEVGGRFVCGRCHYQGIPISFDDADEYAKFVRELRTA